MNCTQEENTAEDSNFMKQLLQLTSTLKDLVVNHWGMINMDRCGLGAAGGDCRLLLAPPLVAAIISVEYW